MSFYFADPIWLLLIAPAAVYLAFVARRSLVNVPPLQRAAMLTARMLLAVLILSALGRPRIPAGAKDLSISILLDLSDSMRPKEINDNLELARRLVHDAKGANPKVFAFARNAAAVNEGLTAEMLDKAAGVLDREATDLQSALLTGLGAAKGGTAPRLVLLSDGLHTEGTLSLAIERAKAQGAKVLYFEPAARGDPEVAVAGLEVPDTARPAAHFTCTAHVESTVAVDATLKFYRAGFLVSERQVKLEPGTNLFRFETFFPADTGQFGKLRVECSAARDTELRNNTAMAIVNLEKRPRVLLVSGREEDGKFLKDALKASDLEVDARGPYGLPQGLEGFAGYDLVILDDVSATRVGADQMANLEHYVRDLGGGFILLGSEQAMSFYGSGVEELLPVRFEGRRKIVDRSVAIVFVIDKSGSMGGQKIELAKSAVVASLDLLAPTDRVGVVAFDQTPEVFAPLSSASRRGEVADKVRRIQASGGTNLYPALDEAYKQLAMAGEKYKHIIVLSDGRSQKSEYDGLMEQMTRLRITLSTISIGADADKELLGRLAELGSGRSYYTDDPMNIPQIFTRETLQVAQNSVVDGPFQPLVARPSAILRGVKMQEAPFLLGYVAAEAKNGAEVILANEGGDPILARWQQGLGKSAFFASDAKNRWAAEWLSWAGFGAFWTQFARDMMRTGALEHNLALGVRPVRGGLEVSLTAMDDMGRYVSDGKAQANVVGPDGTTSRAELALDAPGLYRAVVPTEQSGVLNVAVTFKRADKSVTVNRGVAMQYGAELTRMKPDGELLESLARATSGWRARSLADVLRPAKGEGRIYREMWPWLIGLSIVVFLLDLLVRRLNFGFAPVRPIGEKK